ncbi:MAG: hypothetical protein ACI4UA_07145 [Bacteroidaceae bacterium]
MKHFRITSYTTSDWLKQLALLLVLCLLGRLLIASLSHGHYVYAAGLSLGMAGWAVIYLRMMRRLRDKNPQD